MALLPPIIVNPNLTTLVLRLAVLTLVIYLRHRRLATVTLWLLRYEFNSGRLFMSIRCLLSCSRGVWIPICNAPWHVIAGRVAIRRRRR